MIAFLYHLIWSERRQRMSKRHSISFIKQIQSKERDLGSLRTKNEALEAKIREMQEKYKKELEDLQVRLVRGSGEWVREWRNELVNESLYRSRHTIPPSSILESKCEIHTHKILNTHTVRLVHVTPSVNFHFHFCGRPGLRPCSLSWNPSRRKSLCTCVSTRNFWTWRWPWRLRSLPTGEVTPTLTQACTLG